MKKRHVTTTLAAALITATLCRFLPRRAPSKITFSE